MFTFNGSSRKPRVVNLSGRKSTVPPRGSKPLQSASLANAQKERAEREAERRQLKAASNIQRVWRGRRVVGIQRAQWRREWDEEFGGETKGSWIKGIALFIAFNQRGFGVRRDPKDRIDEVGFGERRGGSIKVAKGCRERIQDPHDFERIKVLVSLVMDAIKNGDNMVGEDPKRSRYLLGQFAKLLVETLYDDPEMADLPGKAMNDDSLRNYSLRLLPWLAERLPTLVDAKYYQALSRVTTACEADLEALLRAVLTPLRSKNERTAWSYTAFAANYLTTPGLPERLGVKGFCMLREEVDIEKLFKAIEATPGAWLGAEVEERLWLLAYIIDFLFASSSRKTIIDLTGDDPLRFNRDVEQQRVLSLLLASVSAEASKRIDIEDVPMGQEEEEDSDEEDSTDIKSRSNKKQPLPPFVKSRLEGLVQQSSVSTVFSQTKYTDFNDAKVFAGFTLTLLLVFPRKSQDVRMWLCLAETSDGASAVRFLWEAVRRTSLYSGISRDYKVAVESLKKRNNSEDSAQTDDDEEWNLILLFVELYGFLLMVMDDDEFFAGRGIKDRQLPLKEVGEMSVFLKSMTFAMYWAGGEIIGEDKSKTSGGEIYFKDQNSKGWSVDYLRAQATTLLKQLYTREYVHFQILKALLTGVVLDEVFSLKATGS
jgi:ubiquitin-protein ligase E3 C